ncbi:MAG TPA: ATP-binding protein, partial [Gemmatimonadaceae bacterium]
MVTSSFHATGAWPPQTEAALEKAAKERHLVETHVLELKREVGAGDKENKELARDLASLAIDGGLLIIGVDEDMDYALTPVPLDGLAERVEQVAGSRIDEPLPVQFFAIESAAKPSDGYLLVRVPASPRAPHMVDNRYWGRGDKTKHVLSDAQVERLIALRSRWAVNAEQALMEWIAADPISPDKRENAHLFVVADPVPPRQRLLLPVLGVGDYTATFRDLVAATKHQAPGTFVPDMPTHLSNFSTTADGWAWKSYSVFGQRDEGEQGRERERGALIVEICENGQLRMMCGRAT